PRWWRPGPGWPRRTRCAAGPATPTRPAASSTRPPPRRPRRARRAPTPPGPGRPPPGRAGGRGAAGRWGRAPGTPGGRGGGGSGGVLVEDSIGLVHLAVLIANPRQEIQAADLVAGLAGLQGADAGTAQRVLDPEAIAEYRNRLRRLDTELGETGVDELEPGRA